MISQPSAVDRLFELAVEASPAGIVVIDGGGRIVFANRALERQFGYDRGELVGQPFAVLVPVPLTAGGDVSGRCKDGSTVALAVGISHIRTRSGEFVLASIADITERAREEAARVVALDERREFERLVGELSGQFINQPIEEVDRAIVDAFAQSARWLGIQRATLFEASPDALVALVTWDAVPDMAPGSLSRDRYPWTIDRCQEGHISAFSTLDEIPPASEREAYRGAGVASGVVVPLAVSGAVAGAAGFYRTREGPAWDDVTVGRLFVIASVLGQVLARRRRDATLRDAIADVEQLRCDLERENVQLKSEARSLLAGTTIIGTSEAVHRVLDQIRQVAVTDSTVLLFGETGTGKELFATEIHELSVRRSRAMVRTNCAAIPATLIESELFGREKGAFTGALARQIGRFELASGSTIFLDEIGDLPPEVQVKLLRVLEEGQIERLGSPLPIHVDVRIIAATHRNLEQRVAEGTFREDLYYRLNVFPIRVPPLRERIEDIPLLVWRFVDEFSKLFGKRIEAIAPESLAALARHSWPGNIRELRNVVERAMITATGPCLTIPAPPASKAAATHSSRLVDVEREHIRSVLEGTGWRIRGAHGAAAVLGLKPTTLETRLGKLGLKRPATLHG